VGDCEGPGEVEDYEVPGVIWVTDLSMAK